MSIINNYFMAADSAVKTLARRIGKDIGNLTNLETTDKTSVVAAVNELFNELVSAFQDLYGKVNAIEGDFARKTDLTPLATKSDLSIQIADLIGGADADNDTLKEIADRVTALAQADNGLVSTLEAQEFGESQKQQARDNIGAAAKSDIPDISGLATKAESDTNYHKKAVTYTRTEMDGRYPLKAASYTKTESDGKYALKSASYTKADSDTIYHNKAVTYTRTEMDSRYYTKTEANSTFAKVWTGTLTEYNAITTKDGNTIYIVT